MFLSTINTNKNVKQLKVIQELVNQNKKWLTYLKNYLKYRKNIKEFILRPCTWQQRMNPEHNIGQVNNRSRQTIQGDY